MYRVKVKTAVYFNNQRYEVGEEVEVSEKDLDDRLFEVLEKLPVDLESLAVKELKKIAKEKEIEGCSDMKKEELIEAIESTEGE